MPGPTPINDTRFADLTPVEGGVTPSPTPIPSLSPAIKLASKTNTGFYWPTSYEYRGEDNWLHAGFNCPDPGHFYRGGGYADGQYSLGVDISGDEGHPDGSIQNAPVVAIADGYVVDVQSEGWTGFINGLDRVKNKGVVVEHYLSDGQPFTAVYGNVATDITVGSQVTAGVPFARVGDDDQPRLHFGIFPGVATSIKDRNTLKAMFCPRDGQKPETNGSVDPVAWITTRSPGPIPSRVTTTARMFGLDDLPNLVMQPSDVDSSFIVTDVIPFTLYLREEALRYTLVDQRHQAMLRADAPPVTVAINGVSREGTFILSYVTLFADESSARRGFQVITDFEKSGKNDNKLGGPLAEVNTAGLGDESYGDYGKQANLAVSSCIWRVRNAVTTLAGMGSFSEHNVCDTAYKMFTHQR
jgi:murein DD-endopeptidase MepM/ murein hydrolase activator NlpD